MIFRIEAPKNTHELIDYDVISMAKMLGDKDFKLVRRLSNSNVSILDRWVKPSCGFNKKYKNRNEPCDVSLWGSFLLLSPFAYESLSSNLSAHGEFLPIDLNGTDWWLFNCLELGAESLSDCVIHEAAHSTELEKLVFDESTLSEKLIFKSKLEGCKTLFCDDRVKMAVTQLPVCGVNFNTNLVAQFLVL
ncbi:MAG: hypothetical protein KKE72_05060 [Gammaproteobacteria bacterium]|nr:hypothetical protein [Gammaproteobacteria bacterium]MBU2204051.1 hypothetical protein [Gammaproteobacteria bacterium]